MQKQISSLNQNVQKNTIKHTKYKSILCRNNAEIQIEMTSKEYTLEKKSLSFSPFPFDVWM